MKGSLPPWRRRQLEEKAAQDEERAQRRVGNLMGWTHTCELCGSGRDVKDCDCGSTPERGCLACSECRGDV